MTPLTIGVTGRGSPAPAGVTGTHAGLLARLLALTQSEVLPALAEGVLYAQPPMHALLGLDLPDPHRLARLLHPQPVQSRPARTLTTDGTAAAARADGAEAGAGAPPPPPRHAARRRHVAAARHAAAATCARNYTCPTCLMGSAL